MLYSLIIHGIEHYRPEARLTDEVFYCLFVSVDIEREVVGISVRISDADRSPSGLIHFQVYNGIHL